MTMLLEATAKPSVSPLVLADRMLTLAQDADRAGFSAAADRLVRLACKMWEQKPRLQG